MITTGGTPLHTFVLEHDISEAEGLLISYAQNNRIVLKKRMEDCEINGSVITTKLTQEETLMFSPKGLVEMQIKYKLPNGDVVLSEIFTETASRCLDPEVLN